MESCHEIPPPARVNERIIEQCRSDIESRLKKIIRSLVLVVLRRKHKFVELGEGFQWGRSIGLGRNSRIGRYVYIGANYESFGPVSIGDLSMISSECKIIGADHLYDIPGKPTRLAFATNRRVTVIGSDVWIGMRVTIKEGIRIGNGAVIGSGAVVTQDVDEYTVVGGVPAKYLKNRFKDDTLISHRNSVESI